MPLITQKEWARRQGFSKQYANKLVKDKIIPLTNGLIDEEKANSILASIRNPNQPLRRTQLTGNSQQRDDDLSTLLLKTRIKNEIERGKILESRAKSEIGQLVSIDSVKNAMFAKGRIIRDGILNVPDRVSALLATINDASKIHEILTKELRDVLEELSRD